MGKAAPALDRPFPGSAVRVNAPAGWEMVVRQASGRRATGRHAVVRPVAVPHRITCAARRVSAACSPVLLPVGAGGAIRGRRWDVVLDGLPGNGP